MIDLKLIGMGVAGGAVGAALLVWPTAHGAGLDKGRKEMSTQLEASKRVIIRTVAERDQARAEVDKVNGAIASQVAELAKLMSADKDERTAAALRMEAAATSAAKEAKLAGQRALAAREVIQNVADQCARAGVPDDVVRVLRDITGPVASVGQGRVPTP
jgi:hypothetical protein